MTWAPLGFLGCLLGLSVGPRTSIIALGGLAALMAALTAVPLDPGARAIYEGRGTRGERARTAARRASGVGAAVTMVGAFVALLHSLALPLLVFAVASSPPAIQFVRRHRPSTVRTSNGADGMSVKGLETKRLCLEWRASYTRVSQADSVAALAREARRRQEYLDEMERRSGTGFRAWLETGPRPDDDPECFVNSEEPRGDRPPSGG